MTGPAVSAELEQIVLENSERVAALERVFEEARALVTGNPCHAHDLRPCVVCLVGTHWRDLLAAVEEAELAR